jgi:hypothetical protein
LLSRCSRPPPDNCKRWRESVAAICLDQIGRERRIALDRGQKGSPGGKLAQEMIERSRAEIVNARRKAPQAQID